MNTSDTNPSLETLRSDFAGFRARCGFSARIPKHLRQAVFAALESGVESAHVTKALGLSRSQIAVWRRGRPMARNEVAAEIPPRILSVIAPAPLAEKGPSGLRASYEAGRFLLELSF